MNIYELLFIFHLFILFGILLAKIYNLMSLCKTYNIKIAFLLFISYFIAWIGGFVIMMLNPEILIYNVLFRIGTWSITLNTLFLMIEIFFFLKSGSTPEIRPYMSRDMIISENKR